MKRLLIVIVGLVISFVVGYNITPSPLKIDVQKNIQSGSLTLDLDDQCIIQPNGSNTCHY